MAQKRTKTAANLRAARALIAKPQCWTKHLTGWGDERQRRTLYEAVYDATQVSPPPTPEFKALCRALGEGWSVDKLLYFNRDASRGSTLVVA